MTPVFVNDGHRCACTMLGHALSMGADAQVWADLTSVLHGRLTDLERRLMLATMIRAMHPDDALHVFETVLPARRAGPPLPVLDEIADDARWWADLASRPEIEAWLAACFARLPAREQQAFLDAASRRVAA